MHLVPSVLLVAAAAAGLLVQGHPLTPDRQAVGPFSEPELAAVGFRLVPNPTAGSRAYMRGQFETAFAPGISKLETDSFPSARQGAGNSDDVFHFVPQFSGSPLPGQSNPATWENGRCFQQGAATLNADASAILLTLQKPKDLFCSEILLFATVKRFFLQTYAIHGEHTVHIVGGYSPEELEDVRQNGMRIFNIHLSTIGEVKSLFDTLSVFLSPHHIVEDNLRWLKDQANITFSPRDPTPVFVPASEIKSGAFLGIIRFDGLDPMISFGTGSRLGHTAITLRFYNGSDDKEGTLYVCESTDKNPFGKPYWPADQRGIIRNKYEDWVQLAIKAEYQVILAPLSAEAQARFDEKKAAEFFFQNEGNSYGYWNFVYGFYDVPNQLIQQNLGEQFLSVGLPIADRLIHDNISMIFTQGLNKRLQHYFNIPESQACEYLDCVIGFAEKFNKSLGELVSLVELDEWTYPGPNGPQLSMVCDVFVTRMMKEAGVFGSMPFNAAELGPRDFYQLNIFESNWDRPVQCTKTDDYPYCQLIGAYSVNLVEDGFNTLTPYAHMAERCSTTAPNYQKPAGC